MGEIAIAVVRPRRCASDRWDSGCSIDAEQPARHAIPMGFPALGTARGGIAV
jgi:hypothetical protein